MIIVYNLPYDIFWSNFVDEYRKRCFLFYNNLYLNYSDNFFFKNKYLLPKAVTYGLNFPEKLLVNFSDSKSFNKRYISPDSLVCFVAG